MTMTQQIVQHPSPTNRTSETPETTRSAIWRRGEHQEEYLDFEEFPTPACRWGNVLHESQTDVYAAWHAFQ